MASEPTSASTLPAVLDSFTDYLDHRSAWSTKAWERWLREFARFGVEGETADELIAHAREVLARV